MGLIVRLPAGDSIITGKIGVLPNAAVEVLTQIELGLIHIGSGLGVRLREEHEILALRKLCESHSGFHYSNCASKVVVLLDYIISSISYASTPPHELS
jgi:hypothetical protein